MIIQRNQRVAEDAKVLDLLLTIIRKIKAKNVAAVEKGVDINGGSSLKHTQLLIIGMEGRMYK